MIRSVIGIGTGPIFDTTEKEAVQALVYAYEHGANYLISPPLAPEPFPTRERLWGPCGRSCSTRSILAPTMRLASMADHGSDTVKRQVDWQLKELKQTTSTSGMIHCLDEERDWAAYQKNGVLDYLLDMKKNGTVRHIGLSTHTPGLAQKILDTGLVEQMIFSINPSYDYQHGEFTSAV